MGIWYSYPEGSTLKGRRSTRDPLSPANLGEAEPSEEIVFPFADILRVLKPNNKSRNTNWKRAYKSEEKHGFHSYDWYTWRGYKLDDAIQICYDIAEIEKFKRIDPDGAAGKMSMAYYDFQDAIPSAVAARILGLEVPDFIYAGRINFGSKLPFETHPRRKMYPWISRSLARKSDIKEMLESGEYPGVISYDGPVDRPGQGDQNLQSA